MLISEPLVDGHDHVSLVLVELVTALLFLDDHAHA
jgi:hypothetical protein